MSDQMMVTSIEMPVSHESYQKLVNFCLDFDIENVPRRQNMLYGVACFEGVNRIDAEIGNMKYLMGDLELDVVEGIGTPNSILVITGESPALEQLSYTYMIEEGRELTPCTDEPFLGIVLSYDYEGTHDLDALSARINDYVEGKLSFDEIQVRYLTEDEYELSLDGVDFE